MNKLMSWASAQQQALQFMQPNLTRVLDPQGSEMPVFWKNPMASKVVTARFPPDFGPKMPLDPNNAVVLGGMCLLNTVEMKRIYAKEITFGSVKDFEAWFSSWYPRIDQVHDTVGIPPGNCRRIVYVSEDSFFAGRLASYTGLDRSEIQSVLRSVHQSQGHAVLSRYLRCMGYRGDVSVVYTSDIEKEMDVALRMWERMLGIAFRACDRDFAKVELMYTGFWLDILKVKTSGVIFEASSKMILKGWLHLADWVSRQKYGTGMNRNLGIVGYLPFLTTAGDASLTALDEVPNFGNFRAYQIPSKEVLWYTANLLFPKRAVTEAGPADLPEQKALELIRSDLIQYYGG